MNSLPEDVGIEVLAGVIAHLAYSEDEIDQQEAADIVRRMMMADIIRLPQMVPFTASGDADDVAAELLTWLDETGATIHQAYFKAVAAQVMAIDIVHQLVTACETGSLVKAEGPIQ